MTPRSKTLPLPPLPHPSVTLGLSACLAFLVTWGIVRSISWPLVHDASLMHYIAQQILHGAVPYRDIFDMNMPGTYLTHMFIQQFIGTGDLAWRLFDLVWLGLICLSLYAAYSTLSKWIGVLVVLFFSALHIGGGALSVGQRDFILLLYFTAPIFFLNRYLTVKPNGWLLFGAGVFLGLAVMNKPFAILFPLVLWIVLAVYLKDFRKTTRSTIWLTTGFLLPIGLIFFWLDSSNALQPFLDIVFHYLVPYYGSFHCVTPTILLQKIVVTPFLIPILSLLPFVIKQRIYKSPLFLISILGLIYGIVHYLLQCRGTYYHTYPYAMFLFSLISIGLMAGFRDPKVGKWLATANLLLMVVMLGQPLYQNSLQDQNLSTLRPAVFQLRDDLLELGISPDDEVQMMDLAEGGLHTLYLLDIPIPTAFVYDFYLLDRVNEPYIQGLQKQFMQEISERRPKYIVVFDTGWYQSDTGLSRLENFPEFVKFIRDNYKLSIHHNSYAIYSIAIKE